MSLGLVAYGSSDESDSEEEDCESSSKIVCKNPKPDLLINSDGENGVPDYKQDCKVALSTSNIISKPNDNIGLARNSVCGEVLNNLTSEISDDDMDNNLSQSDVRGVKNAEKKTILGLPAPKVNKLHDIDFDWSRLSSKKPNMPVKISVPSLSELDSEESSEPVKKKVKPSKTRSGLFALLPSPKNNFINLSKSTLKPLQIGNKVNKPISQNSSNKNIRKVNNIQTKKNVPLSVDYDSPDEDEISGGQKVDFFSLSSQIDVPACDIQIPDETYDIKSSTNKSQVPINQEFLERDKRIVPECNRMPSASSSTVLNATCGTSNSSVSYINSYESESFIPLQTAEEKEDTIELDETALQHLCGRRERHAGGSGVQLIDVKGDAILPDAREWMTKQLTEEQNLSIHSHKKKDGPTTQQRRKHQITYLAFQAKEHELELKNQWANNRMSRKQTQAKYGF